MAAPDRTALVEALCIQEERVVERDNTVTWRKLKLALPDSPLRHHCVKARVRIHQYPDDTLALFHGPSCIARIPTVAFHQNRTIDVLQKPDNLKSYRQRKIANKAEQRHTEPWSEE